MYKTSITGLDVPKNVVKQVSSYFPALTGLRALAAYSVYLFHYNPFNPKSWAGKFINEGHIGVTLFFVLSGLLICIRYMDRVELTRKWLSKYLRNRVARIYPMYFIITVCTFFLTWLQPGRDISGHWLKFSGYERFLTVLLNLTLLRGFFQDFVSTGILPGWTLTVEETFYLLAPLLLIGLIRFSVISRYILLLLYGICFLIIGFALVTFAPHKFGFFASYGYMLDITFFGRCFEFLFGMALAVFIRSEHNFKAASYSWATWVGIAWILFCVLFCVLGLAGNPPSGHGMRTINFRNIINNLILPPGIALLFWGVIHEKTWMRKLLSSQIFDLLGKSSYVFYLIHMGIFTMAIYRYVTSNSAIAFLLLVGLSIVLHLFVEEPAHKFIARRKSNKV